MKSLSDVLGRCTKCHEITSLFDPCCIGKIVVDGYPSEPIYNIDNIIELPRGNDDTEIDDYDGAS